jgi:hypothetical protein
MSRKAAIVEEFDDDTDLPLPSQPLPSTGRGPLLQEIDTDDDDLEPSQQAGPASPASQSQFRPDASGANIFEPKNTVTDITPYKTCVPFIFYEESNIEKATDGHVSILYISMQNVRTAQVNAEWRVRRAYGGHSAKILPRPQIGWGWARYMKSARLIPGTGKILDA